MKRVPEPELMDDQEQARAYADADFSESNELFADNFARLFPELCSGRILDIGCGPADIDLLLAHRHPRLRIDGVDGSKAMLDIGRDRLSGDPGIGDRIRLIEGLIPGVKLPARHYDGFVSNSLLHHLHQPGVLWDSIRSWGTSGAAVMVMDLFRPQSESHAQELVETYASDAPAVLKRDFYLSLLAAFTPDEVIHQLEMTSLGYFTVAKTSDRHMLISGHLA